MILTQTEGNYLSPQKLDAINQVVRNKFSYDKRTKKGSFGLKEIDSLKSMNVTLDGHPDIAALRSASGFAMDTTYPYPYQSSVTTPSVGVLLQKVQNFLPGMIQILTAKRTGDLITGIFNTGSWEDQQIVRGDIEMTGYPNEYDDMSNIPYASDNVNWTTRTVVRFMIGMSVGLLETAQYSRMGVNQNQYKMNSCAYNLEVIRNTVNIYGYNNGANETYGILTDPNLSAFQEVPEKISTTTDWASATAEEIYEDYLTALQYLIDGANGNISFKTPMKFVVAQAAYVWLLKTTVFLQGAGTVLDFIQKTFPNVEIIACPQFNDAYLDSNVFYLFAVDIDDDSTDDHKTVIQPIPARMQNLGIRQDIQSYSQGYVMATAGCFFQRPWAVVRYYGI